MKPRARRITIGAAAVAVVLVAVLAVAYWATVRDHVEAWHFQLTRKAKTITPAELLAEHALDGAANHVIFDPQEVPAFFTSGVAMEDMARPRARCTSS